MIIYIFDIYIKQKAHNSFQMVLFQTLALTRLFKAFIIV